MKKQLGLLTGFLILAACQTKNPPISGPAKTPAAKIDYQAAETDATGITVDVDTRVDILFVIDDSASMKAHQENLSRNIHRFVDAIAETKNIDFHIGYTVSHDQNRYGTIVPEVCPDGRVNFEAAGSLRKLKGPANLLPTDGRRYVTSADDFRAILRDSLDPKTNPELIKEFLPNAEKPDACPGGPEDEDLFTPLLRAVDNPIITEGVNKGFRRPGALFVAILLSDAKDGSGMSPDDVLAQLRATVGADKARVFAVAMAPGFVINRGSRDWEDCKPDPAWSLGQKQVRGGSVVIWPGRDGQPPKTVGPDDNPLVVLARGTENEDAEKKQSHVLSICTKNYGEVLAEFGTQIKKDALRDLVIHLPEAAQISTELKNQISVTFGQDVLVKGSRSNPNAQWGHNVQSESIVIYSDRVDWSKYPGEKVRVNFTPAPLTGQNTKTVWK